MDGTTLYIDFGTTTTTVGIWNDRLHILRNLANGPDSSYPGIPSRILYPPLEHNLRGSERGPKVGIDVVIQETGRAVECFKLALDHSSETHERRDRLCAQALEMNFQTYDPEPKPYPEQFILDFLIGLRSKVQDILAEKKIPTPSNIVASIPASYSLISIEQYKTILEQTWCLPVQLLSEPVATLLGLEERLKERMKKLSLSKAKIFLIDLGGGTTDITEANTKFIGDGTAQHLVHDIEKTKGISIGGDHVDIAFEKWYRNKFAPAPTANTKLDGESGENPSTFHQQVAGETNYFHYQIKTRWPFETSLTKANLSFDGRTIGYEDMKAITAKPEHDIVKFCHDTYCKSGHCNIVIISGGNANSRSLLGQLRKIFPEILCPDSLELAPVIIEGLHHYTSYPERTHFLRARHTLCMEIFTRADWIYGYVPDKGLDIVYEGTELFEARQYTIMKEGTVIQDFREVLSDWVYADIDNRKNLEPTIELDLRVPKKAQTPYQQDDDDREFYYRSQCEYWCTISASLPELKLAASAKKKAWYKISVACVGDNLHLEVRYYSDGCRSKTLENGGIWNKRQVTKSLDVLANKASFNTGNKRLVVEDTNKRRQVKPHISPGMAEQYLKRVDVAKIRVQHQVGSTGLL